MMHVRHRHWKLKPMRSPVHDVERTWRSAAAQGQCMGRRWSVGSGKGRLVCRWNTRERSKHLGMRERSRRSRGRRSREMSGWKHQAC